MFEEIKKMCNELLDKTYTVIGDEKIKDIVYGDYEHPEIIQRELISFFNIDEECSHIILFEWLYLNGMRKILSRWGCHENLWGREMRHPINWEVTNNDVMNQTLYADWCSQISDNPSSRTYEPERHNRPMVFFNPDTDNISMSSVSHRYVD